MADRLRLDEPDQDPDDDPLLRLRALCMALPAVEERLSHGEPTWFVGGKKTFVMYADRHHDDRLALWCAAVLGVQQDLVANRPGSFFRPPYVGGRGWLGVYLDVAVSWDELADLVEDAYRAVAGRRRIAELDAAVSGGSPARPTG